MLPFYILRAMTQRFRVGIFVCLPAALFAQEFRGSISGAVSDPQGAIVVNVKIVARELATGTESTTQSDASGKFIYSFLTARQLSGGRRSGGLQALRA